MGKTEKQDGRYGISADGQFDFIPTGKPQFLPARFLTRTEFDAIEPLFAPTTIDIVRVHLGRLAMMKKPGGVSEGMAAAFFQDVAFEISEFSQMAILLAFREIKRADGVWLPELPALIRACERWQEYVDNLFAANSPASPQISHRPSNVA